ncbi:hypothetical protein [Limnoglobus roseus]|uniref:Uncharacterized protein n=1 Tax=Limnoglobus roseus TaxID=2598579 RepID=A0A5C1AM23_9BACT|nr:hypothetical protein [Limnoglobus roseus]QEL19016.1 hypothetical protein PX52LOC_06068 [Limnoglobus roseus]
MNEVRKRLTASRQYASEKFVIGEGGGFDLNAEFVHGWKKANGYPTAPPKKPTAETPSVPEPIAYRMQSVEPSANGTGDDKLCTCNGETNGTH